MQVVDLSTWYISLAGAQALRADGGMNDPNGRLSNRSITKACSRKEGRREEGEAPQFSRYVEIKITLER